MGFLAVQMAVRANSLSEKQGLPDAELGEDASELADFSVHNNELGTGFVRQSRTTPLAARWERNSTCIVMNLVNWPRSNVSVQLRFVANNTCLACTFPGGV
jgi:hypothetical protein